MPRRSGGGPARRSSPSRGLSSRSNLPARTAPPPPPAPVQAPPSAVGQPRQPGMFAQMATTAAGVAVGSAVGHTLGAAMTGGLGGSRAPAEQPVEQQQQPAYNQQQTSGGDNPCAYQLRQFIECAQSQHDITLCQGFNEALRECRVSYGLPLQ
ncbi:hypothetical protein HELRODRAFT_187955 [Helobdella robusta]|uniref:CHCH domain-containing protein n=1 Tax=Helobdella robusta TaxID=6412 RepID=T1FPI2_HELRO|nr:hypothetical protein HELRODRAFT_187955 [Helobdella robusta]ESO12684.1 hypothetical protein HELRODRAFT_187955 [Helobdella robusta]